MRILQFRMEQGNAQSGAYHGHGGTEPEAAAHIAPGGIGDTAQIEMTIRGRKAPSAPFSELMGGTDRRRGNAPTAQSAS